LPRSIPNFRKGKVVTFPLAKNQILARFENIGDKFDHFAKDLGVMEVDLESWATDLFAQANNNHWTADFDIQEVDLTNNRLSKDVESSRHKWRAEEEFDNTGIPQVEVYDQANGSVISLPPQSIRSFVITFKPTKVETDAFLQ